MSEQYLDLLTLKDIAEISSPSASNQYYTEKNSKAYANAMRALQEKIRSLESENAYLRDKISSIETKSSFNSQKCQERLMEEAKIWSQKEKNLQNAIFNLEQKIKEINEKLLISEEKLKIKDDHIWHQSSQEKMNYEQFNLDRENSRLEIEHLRRQLNNEINEHKNSSNIAMRLEKEKSRIEEENSQLRRVNGILEEEIELLKESAKKQKITHFEGEKPYDYIQKIKELEYENKKLNETAANQKQQLDILQREIEEIYSSQKVLSNSNISSLNSPSSRKEFSSYKKSRESSSLKKSSKIKLLHSPSSRKDLSPYKGIQKLKKLKNNISVKNTGNVKRPDSPLCETCAKEDETPLKSSLKKRPSQKSTSGPIRANELQEMTEYEIADSIQRLENEISVLGQKYKQLLHLSQEEDSDLGVLRKEITETSAEIQQKSDALYELKRKRHTILREKLPA